MNPEVLGLLKCAVCDSTRLSHVSFDEDADGEIVQGVVWCEACRTWYAVEDGLLEFLAGELAYQDDRARFWATYADKLTALGLRPDEDIEGAPEKEQQRKQQSHFDWYASSEEQTYSEYERTPFWLAADRIAFAPWRRELQSRPGKWLLDVGCAQGRSTFKVMDLDLDVVGFDVSKRLVRQAIDRYRAGNYTARATFFAADATRLPFVEQTFDYVLIYGVLHHLPDPPATCREVARVLKPEGIYFGQENNRTAFRAIFDLLQRLNPLWHEEAGPAALISARDFDRWFEDTGVEIDTQTSVFLPPHLINLAGEKLGYGLLNTADGIGRVTPFLRQNGGVILVRGTRENIASWSNSAH